MIGVLGVIAFACRRERDRAVPTPASETADVASVAPPPKAPAPGFAFADASCNAAVHATNRALCQVDFEATRADANALEYVRCVEACTDPESTRDRLDCLSECFAAGGDAGGSKGVDAASGYLFCVCCRSPAVEACSETCARYQRSASGPVGAGCSYPAFEHASGACNLCIDRAMDGETSVPFADPSKRVAGDAKCHDEYIACLHDGPCFDFVDCVSACPATKPPEDCASDCRKKHGPSPLGAAYVSCMCAKDVCGGTCAGCSQLVAALSAKK